MLAAAHSPDRPDGPESRAVMDTVREGRLISVAFSAASWSVPASEGVANAWRRRRRRPPPPLLLVTAEQLRRDDDAVHANAPFGKLLDGEGACVLRFARLSAA